MPASPETPLGDALYATFRALPARERSRFLRLLDADREDERLGRMADERRSEETVTWEVYRAGRAARVR